jgi:hypothetical protein
MAAPHDESGLSIQDLSKLDCALLTPLTPEVISRQATINVGTIGHVAHGKSTVSRRGRARRKKARGRQGRQPTRAVARVFSRKVL